MEAVLLIAAEAIELKGIEARLPSPVRLQWPVAHARCAEHRPYQWFLLANGPGPALAGEAVDVALARISPVAIVSTGFCGGLDPDLRAADVVVADSVVCAETGRSFPAARPAGAADRPHGPIACGNRVVQKVSEKQELRRRFGAIAVDMESSAVAARALAAGLPFYCLRAVSDTAAEGFAIDFNAARGAGGRFRPLSILAQVLRRPWAGLPELVRLGRRAGCAASALGDVLVHCRY